MNNYYHDHSHYGNNNNNQSLRQQQNWYAKNHATPGGHDYHYSNNYTRDQRSLHANQQNSEYPANSQWYDQCRKQENSNVRQQQQQQYYYNNNNYRSYQNHD